MSAVAFLSNVMREIFAIITIPIVAKYVGYVECASLPGAAAMDTVLPVVVGATHERITIYSFTSGVVLSLAGAPAGARHRGPALLRGGLLHGN